MTSHAIALLIGVESLGDASAVRRRGAFAAQHDRGTGPTFFTGSSQDSHDATAMTVPGVPARRTSIALARTRRG
jgi:hypothetical protein